MRRAVLSWQAAWALAALAVMALVYLTQIDGRAPLVYDEAVRLLAGVGLGDALDAASAQGVWDWSNEQQFYPFLSSGVVGLTLWLTGDSIVAAWLPSLLAFGACGLLVGALAVTLGAGRAGGLLAAVLFWLIPIEARVATGAFTEPFGCLIEAGLLLLLVMLERRRTLGLAVACGAVVAAAWWFKYDYGLVAGATLGVMGLVALAAKPRRPALLRYGVASGVALVLIGGLLAFNTEHKLRGSGRFISKAVPGLADTDKESVYDRRTDLTFYARALFTDEEVGLSIPLALLLCGGLAWGVVSWRSRPEVRPAVVFTAVWFGAYSVSLYHFARYGATLMPALAALAGAALTDAARRLAARPGRGPRLALAGGAALLVALLALQLPKLGERFWFLEPNPPAQAVADFALSQLPDREQPVLLVGQSNEVSQPAVRLAWAVRLGRTPPRVELVREAPPERRRLRLVRTLRRVRPERILAIDVRPGSRLDTDDFRSVFASQPTYVRLLEEMAAAGGLRRVGASSADEGRLRVTTWACVSPCGGGRR